MSKIDIYRNRLQQSEATELSLKEELKDAKALYKKTITNLKEDQKQRVDRYNLRIVDVGKRLAVIRAFLKEKEDPQIEVDQEIEKAVTK